LLKTILNLNKQTNSTFFFTVLFSYKDLISNLSLRSQISFFFLPPSSSSFLKIVFLFALSFTIVYLLLTVIYYFLPCLFIMNITKVYTIIIGGSFGLLLLINSLLLIARLIKYFLPFVSKHLIYCYILQRHRLLSP
jgi:hypothetical protein